MTIAVNTAVTDDRNKVFCDERIDEAPPISVTDEPDEVEEDAAAENAAVPVASITSEGMVASRKEALHTVPPMKSCTS